MMNLTPSDLYKCHEAIQIMATIISKIPQMEDGGLEVDVAENFGRAIATMNYVCAKWNLLNLAEDEKNDKAN